MSPVQFPVFADSASTNSAPARSEDPYRIALSTDELRLALVALTKEEFYEWVGTRLVAAVEGAK